MLFAYLITIHENNFVLRSLLSIIDDPRNDIFIHVDVKTVFDFENELFSIVKKSKLYFTKERINVSWAHITQVEAEYVLFEEAYQKRKYDYYHLISGSDLPIKSQNDIHEFFSINNGMEFIGFSKNCLPERIKYIHLFSKKFRSTNPFYSISRNVFLYIQKCLGYNLLSDISWEPKKGTNWVSVTDKFVHYMLLNKNAILSKFKYAKSPDEHYKQVLAYNSSFRNKLYSYEDEFEGCMRHIDWLRGGPYEWKLNDFSEILSSNKLFARKFCSRDTILIKKIIKQIQ